MLLKSTKKEMVKGLEKAITSSKSIVFVNFHGLKVGDETLLRQDLRKNGVNYKISRKTLLKIALKDKATGTLPDLSGEVAIAYSDDSISPAREIYNFQKTYKSPINIIGGIFDGKFVDEAFMKEIATIPSREVLLSKIAFLLQSPMQRLAIAVNQIAKTKS